MNRAETHDKNANYETLVKEFKSIIARYITRVNSRYRGNEFTSSQLAKTVITTAEIEKTRFPIIHRLVKEILNTWEQQDLCAQISRTKYSRCRKTKDTYRFTTQGIREIRKEAIDGTIRRINEGELEESPIMKRRQEIIKDKIEELVDSTLGSQTRFAQRET
jgi:hypothetical protein